MARELIRDEDVEKEIARLMNSEYVKLARAEMYVKNRRRQYMYTLRHFEKRGKELAAEGITQDTLSEMLLEAGEEISE